MYSDWAARVLKKEWFSVGARRELQYGKAGMKDSGKTTRSADPSFEAREMREMHFLVVSWAERKTGEVWQAAARRRFGSAMVN